MEFQHEASSLDVRCIYVQVTVHLQGHLLADGQSQTVARSKVSDLAEGFEDVVALFLGDAAASVRHQELVRMGTTLLIIQTDGTAGRGVFSGIAEQVRQDV